MWLPRRDPEDIETRFCFVHGFMALNCYEISPDPVAIYCEAYTCQVLGCMARKYYRYGNEAGPCEEHYRDNGGDPRFG
jgi:hypothetical protein